MATRSHPSHGDLDSDLDQVDLIGVAPLVAGSATVDERLAVARLIDRACREIGFFRVTGHGVPSDLFDRLDRAARAFFAEPDERKAEIAMARAGRAWRGWFPVGDELTSGVPDRKEGLYFGVEHPPEHPAVRAGAALHGANLFPPGDLGPAVTEWMEALTRVADAIMGAIALGLGLPETWFRRHLTGDPTVLFRIFHYPALPDNATAPEWGVGEHTDYGLLTLLAQDASGGLQVRTPDGRWIDVPAEPRALVVNIGDMLDKLTEGRYRSTLHRVRNTSGHGRLSFPLFYDPSWDAVVTPLPLDGSPPADDAGRRWDGASLQAWSGTYGEYLSAKVARVFPDLFSGVNGGAG